MSAEQFREALAPGGQSEAEIRAALMTARGINPHQGAAGRAKLRAAFPTAEHSGKKTLPAFKAHLPLIGKGQHSSLRAILKVL